MNVAMQVILVVAGVVLVITTLCVSIFSYLEDSHLWSKFFRRGRGVGKKEFKVLGCQRPEQNVFNLVETLHDPRLSEAQKLLILRDIYIDDPVCPFEDSAHTKTKAPVVLKTVITPQLLDSYSGRKLSGDALAIILRGFPPYTENNRYLNWVTRGDKIFNTINWVEIVMRIMNDSRLSDADFKDTFSLLLDGIETATTLNRGEDLADTMKRALLQMIEGNRFNDQEIMQLCYSKYAWFGAILLSSPRCPEEGKIPIALNTGASRIFSEG